MVPIRCSLLKIIKGTSQGAERFKDTDSFDMTMVVFMLSSNQGC